MFFSALEDLFPDEPGYRQYLWANVLISKRGKWASHLYNSDEETKELLEYLHELINIRPLNQHVQQVRVSAIANAFASEKKAIQLAAGHALLKIAKEENDLVTQITLLSSIKVSEYMIDYQNGYETAVFDILMQIDPVNEDIRSMREQFLENQLIAQYKNLPSILLHGSPQGSFASDTCENLLIR